MESLGITIPSLQPNQSGPLVAPFIEITIYVIAEGNISMAHIGDDGLEFGFCACHCPWIVLFILAISLIALSARPFKHPYQHTMVPPKVYERCHQPATVTSELARDPSQCPTKLFRKLFEGHHLPHVHKSRSESSSDSESEDEKLEELQKARACGNFGSAEPSNLFLQVSETCREIIEVLI